MNNRIIFAWRAAWHNIRQTGIWSRPTMHLPGTTFAERAVHGHINPVHHEKTSAPHRWPTFPTGRRP